MPAFICNTCGTQYAPSEKPPANCPICDDERQYVTPAGQSWTTLPALAGALQQRLARARAEPDLDHHLPGLRHRPARATPAHAARQHPVGLHRAGRPRHRRTDQRHGRPQGASPSRTRTTTPAWSNGAKRFGGIPIHLHAADRKWIMRNGPGDPALAGRDQGAAARADADLLRRPLSGRHGAALGGGRRRQGRALVRRHRAGGAGQQVGELHVELPEFHPAVGPARRGRGEGAQALRSSTASTAPSPTAPSGPTARPWSNARPSAI